MAGVNKVILIGNVGEYPKVKTFDNGDKFCNLSVATSEKWKDKTTGEAKTNTEWHRIVFYRGLAGVVESYVKKGSQIYISGKLKTRKWDKDGVNHYTTEIVADEMQMLGSKGESVSQDGETKPLSNQGGGKSFIDRAVYDDDIPF